MPPKERSTPNEFSSDKILEETRIGNEIDWSRVEEENLVEDELENDCNEY